MSAQQQSGQDQSGSMDYLWGATALVFVVFILWIVGKVYLIHFIFHLKLLELKVIALFTDDALQHREWILENYALATQISWSVLNAKLYQIGLLYYFFCTVILALFALYLYFLSPVTKYHTIFTMKNLLLAQLEQWPFITPIAKLQLIKEDVHKGAWAMTPSPMEFAKTAKFLIPPPTPKRGEKRQIIATIDSEKAKAIFIKQMGPKLHDLNTLPIYIKALVGIFAARIHEEREAPRRLLEQIAASAASGRLNFSGAKKLFNRYKNQPAVQEIFSRHAYVLTFAAAMLEAARADGVLASADFLWLKPLDRKLWYMLNNVGRQTAFTEIAGPFAHWLAEQKMMRRIQEPMVEEAIKAMKDAISNVIYTK